MSFIEKETNYFMLMQLKDLTTSFMKKDVEIQYNQVSFLDIHTPKVSISSFWENRTSFNHLGEKSDIYLRALGNYKYSDRNAFISLKHFYLKSTLPSFIKQLGAFLEDIRLENIILSNRPGTSKAFHFRKEQYTIFFQDQMKVNTTRAFKLDTLFCYLCLCLFNDSPLLEIDHLGISDETLIKMKQNLFSIYECKDTQDVLEVTINIYLLVKNFFKLDMINTYFALPKINETIPYSNDDDEIFNELMPSWTRKRKKKTKETFLQFDDVDGEHQDLKFTDTPRESESTDQVMAIVQGNTRETDLNDHRKSTHNDAVNDNGGYNKGKENRYAVAIEKELKHITNEDIANYEKYKLQIIFEKKKLLKLLSDLLERKRENSNHYLHYGKLDKKLVRFFTNDNPKMFIKKEEDKNFDTCFSLLVDCSSSMLNKMEKVKEAIVLFHETLAELNIPHSITGFWEDGMESDENYQPNYFDEVIPFSDSLRKNSGAAIMKLNPEEDNRDGFSIRHVGSKLATQPGKHKFLLVLTDGKPAAHNYYQNGIMDTKQAIQEIKKQGINTIGIQLDNMNIENEKIMESMYNYRYLIIEKIDGMASQFGNLLKKLLILNI